jgi:hypothetical protein
MTPTGDPRLHPWAPLGAQGPTGACDAYFTITTWQPAKTMINPSPLGLTFEKLPSQGPQLPQKLPSSPLSV